MKSVQLTLLMAGVTGAFCLLAEPSPGAIMRASETAEQVGGQNPVPVPVCYKSPENIPAPNDKCTQSATPQVTVSYTCESDDRNKQCLCATQTKTYNKCSENRTTCSGKLSSKAQDGVVRVINATSCVDNVTVAQPPFVTFTYDNPTSTSVPDCNLCKQAPPPG